MPVHDAPTARAPEVVGVVAGTVCLIPRWLPFPRQYLSADEMRQAQMIHRAVVDTAELFERVDEDRHR